MIFHLLDVACLWLIWWTAFAAIAGGHEVRTWRALVLQLALLGLMASAFVGAIATYMQPGLLPPWGRGMIYATATVAAWLYDYRFGIARHVRMVRDAWLCLWERITRRLA